ncbi:hypothetical protein Syun_011923 [Stephania yunnanensis]|uniref:Uncharacterized protein n=1 Tax=Stephania yunnanensis TaxID=152371 RepID=A0AAP0PET0_9MAGN
MFLINYEKKSSAGQPVYNRRVNEAVALKERFVLGTSVNNLMVPRKFDVRGTSFEMAIKEKTALRLFSSLPGLGPGLGINLATADDVILYDILFPMKIGILKWTCRHKIVLRGLAKRGSSAQSKADFRYKNEEGRFSS